MAHHTAPAPAIGRHAGGLLTTEFSMHLHIPDMHCGGCVRSVTAVITALDANAQVQTELEGRTATVQTSASAEQVLAALEEAGFPATLTG
jgi:copper chaperone